MAAGYRVRLHGKRLGYTEAVAAVPGRLADVAFR